MATGVVNLQLQAARKKCACGVADVPEENQRRGLHNILETSRLERAMFWRLCDAVFGFAGMAHAERDTLGAIGIALFGVVAVFVLLVVE